MRESPVVRGLFLCERIERDILTRQMTLVNRMVRHRVAGFPSGPVGLSVFAALADAEGEFRISLLVEHVESNALVAAHDRVVAFPDRLREVIFVLHVPNLTFAEPGVYEFSLLADGEPLASCLLRVTGPSTGG